MAEMPGQEALQPQHAVAARPKKSPLMPLLLVVVVVAPLGVGGYLLSAKQKQMQQELTKAYEEDPPVVEEVTWPMAVQTVNLADGDRYARIKAEVAFELDPVDAEYLRAAAAIEGGDPAAKEGGEGGHGKEAKGGHGSEAKGKALKTEPGARVKLLAFTLKSQAPRLNDVLIEELSSRNFSSMLRPEDKKAFKRALMKRYNEVLTEVKVEVHDIYFSEFVMQ